MITLINNSLWMYSWEADVAERGFEGCKWLGRFYGRGVIQDIKRVNVDVEASTTMVEIQEWMPIRVLNSCRKQ